MSSRTVTYLVELSVGLGCLAGAAMAWRLPRVRWLTIVLGMAGLTAVLHAAVALTAG